MMKLLARLFDKPVRTILMSEAKEVQIIKQMAEIEGMRDYLELQKQAGYQMFGRTEDRRYLGYVDLANTLLNLFNDLKKPEPSNVIESSGYESEV